MANGRQLVNEKKRKAVEQIVGFKVIAAFMNGDIPHGCAIAWTSFHDAWLVNLQTRIAREYIILGNYMMRKAKVYVNVRDKEEVCAATASGNQ